MLIRSATFSAGAKSLFADKKGFGSVGRNFQERALRRDEGQRTSHGVRWWDTGSSPTASFLPRVQLDTPRRRNLHLSTQCLLESIRPGRGEVAFTSQANNAQDETVESFENGPPEDLYRKGFITQGENPRATYVYVRTLYKTENGGSHDAKAMQIYFTNEVQGDIKVLHLTAAEAEGYNVKVANEVQFSTGTKKFQSSGEASRLNIKQTPRHGMSFSGNVPLSVESTKPACMIPEKAIQHKMDIFPEKFHSLVAWKFDPQKEDKKQWLLRAHTKGRSVSLEEYLTAASFLYDEILPLRQSHVSASSLTSGFGDEDEYIMNQIRRSGPGRCIWRRLSQPEGDELLETDSEDEYAESSFQELHTAVERLHYALYRYSEDWQKGFERIRASKSLTSEEADVLRACLFEDWEVYTHIVFLVLKYRHNDIELFEALAFSRTIVEFICLYIETGLEYGKGFDDEIAFWLTIPRQLLSRHWDKEVNRIQDSVSPSSAFDWIRRKELRRSHRMNGRSVKDDISADLREAMEILNHLHDTVCELTPDEGIRGEEHMSSIRARWDQVVSTLANPMSSVPNDSRRDILQLFVDILQTVEEKSLYLRQTVVNVPSAIDRTLRGFRVHEVLGIMDVHAYCAVYTNEYYNEQK